MSEHADGNVVQLGDFRPNRKCERVPSKARVSEEAKAWSKDASLYWRDFAQRLRITRERLGISEPEAAAALCVTLRTYRKWEATTPRQPRRHRQLCPDAGRLDRLACW